MLPAAHFVNVILVDQTSLDEGVQDSGSHASLDVGKRRRVKFDGSMKADTRRIVRGDGRLEYPVDDAAVEMAVLVQA